MADPTQRFSGRVENYIRYRPGYPAQILSQLGNALEIPVESANAVDVGSGTGIFTKFLLDAGWNVIGIEPNDAMRSAAELELNAHPRFRSVAASAEQTELPDQSADLIAAAQAFHWFDVERVRNEFQRILKPNGRVALIWNERTFDTPFLQAYESALKLYATDYNEVRHDNISGDDIDQFFRDHEAFEYPNAQYFDFDGVLGRLNSSSYAPAPECQEYKLLVAQIKQAFDDHAVDGLVGFRYRAKLHLGSLT